MANQQPESRTARFNRMYGQSRQQKKEPTAEAENSENNTKPKKKNNSANDLSQLGELIRENAEEQKEEQGEHEMTDTFTPTEIQKKACEYLGIDYKDFDNEKSLLAKLESEGIFIRDDKILVRDDKLPELKRSSDDNEFEVVAKTKEELNALKAKEAKEYAERDDGLDLDDLPTRADTEMHFHEGDTPPVRVHEPDEKIDWLEQKVKDYTGMKADGNTDIKTFTKDETARTFTAEVDNGTITYTAENEVTITKDSSYKVFDTVMKEPSNAGKAIRIPEDASPEFKTNLFVAAVLNDHPVNGAERLELDKDALNKIDLNTEQKAAVLAALSKKEKTEEKPEDKKTEEITEEKIEVSKEVQEAIAKMDESKAKLAEIIKDGKVTAAITTNPDTKKSEISFNHDPAKGGIEADATEANKLLSEAIKTLGALRKDIPEDKKAAEQVVLDNYAIKSAQLDLIRSVYQPEPNEAVKAMDRIRAKKLGLTDDPVYRYVKDKKGHLIRNRKGDLVEDKYQRDEAGHFIKDEKGRRIEDESKQVKALEGTERDTYQSKLSAAVLARVKAGHGSK